MATLLERIRTSLGFPQDTPQDPPEAAPNANEASLPTVEELTRQNTALRADKDRLLQEQVAKEIETKVELAAAGLKILPPSKEPLADFYSELYKVGNTDLVKKFDAYVESLLPHPYNQSSIVGPANETNNFGNPATTQEQVKVNTTQALEHYQTGGAK